MKIKFEKIHVYNAHHHLKPLISRLSSQMIVTYLSLGGLTSYVSFPSRKIDSRRTANPHIPGTNFKKPFQIVNNTSALYSNLANINLFALQTKQPVWHSQPGSYCQPIDAVGNQNIHCRSNILFTSSHGRFFSESLESSKKQLSCLFRIRWWVITLP